LQTTYKNTFTHFEYASNAYFLFFFFVFFFCAFCCARMAAEEGKNCMMDSSAKRRVMDLSPLRNLHKDIPAGIVVFLVALPLCLGIALASGAPLLGGLIAGIVGGTVVAFLSGSELSVSGPAAGLTALVAAAIHNLGSYQDFLVSVILAGVLQLIFSFLRAGALGDYVPSSVVRGMLAAVGVVIILKQIPHALGYTVQRREGDFSFLEPTGQTNTFSEIVRAFSTPSPEAIIIVCASFAVLLLWETAPLQKRRWTKLIPAPLVVVALGILLNETFRFFFQDFHLRAEEGQLVQLPVLSSPEAFLGAMNFPNPRALLQSQTYTTAFTIAIVASLETLLSLEATDKLDPYKRISRPNKELTAQGVGNIVSGALGGLPMTAVIVRSSANAYAGGRTRAASMTHGVALILALALLAPLLNRAPLAALAAILIQLGYKLAKVELFRQMFRAGSSQFLPFLATVVAVVFTDLLTGIVIGLCVGLLFVIRANHQSAVLLTHSGERYRLNFTKDMTFINKAELKLKLRHIPDGATALIDGSQARFIDADIHDVIEEFAESARFRGIEVEYVNFPM
jgi:MFS superfamily sulfate permease-like transporter